MILLILVLVLILISLTILVVILLILVIVLVIVLSASAIFLILQHLLGIDVILLRIHVCRIAEKRLLESIDSTLPIFFFYRDITRIVVIISSIGSSRCGFLDLFHHLGRLIKIALTVEIGRKVVIRGNRRGILHERLPVINVSLAPVFLAELPVAGTDVAPVHLGRH